MHIEGLSRANPNWIPDPREKLLPGYRTAGLLG